MNVILNPHWEHCINYTERERDFCSLSLSLSEEYHVREIQKGDTKLKEHNTYSGPRIIQ
jgi:hypothetical protein